MRHPWPVDLNTDIRSCHVAAVSAVMRSMERTVMAEMSRRFREIGLALPSVLTRSHLVLPFSSRCFSNVRWRGVQQGYRAPVGVGEREQRGHPGSRTREAHAHPGGTPGIGEIDPGVAGRRDVDRSQWRPSIPPVAIDFEHERYRRAGSVREVDRAARKSGSAP